MLLTLQRWIGCFAILAVSAEMAAAVEPNRAHAPATYEQPVKDEIGIVAEAISTDPSTSAKSDLAETPLPLVRTQLPNTPAPPTTPTESPVLKTVGSLAVVIGVFAVIVYFMRRTNGPTGQILPSEVLKVLGRVSLNNRHYVQLLRLGDRLLLIAVSASGSQTLTEITEPEEVERLSSACSNQQGRAVSLRNALFAAIPSRRTPRQDHFGDTGRASQSDSEYLGSRHA